MDDGAGKASPKAARPCGKGWPGRRGWAICGTPYAAADGGEKAAALAAGAAAALSGALVGAANDRMFPFEAGCVRGVRAVDCFTVKHSVSRS